MAVIWLRREGATLYEVRSAGATRRLYSNGVLHTQFNPNRPVTGSVWDLLMLPAFFTDTARLERVLVLGVGGGAVLRMLRRFVDPQTLIGIDLDPLHLEVARAHFGVTEQVAQLEQAEARAWLMAYRGPKFDLIIDDLFGHVDGVPARAIEMDEDWGYVLTSNLSDDGVLVANFPDAATLNTSALARSRALRAQFANHYYFTTPHYDNAVAACVRRPTTRTLLREQLRQVPELNPRKASCPLRFRVWECKEK